jgi:CheY-like chemotaxis protein
MSRPAALIVEDHPFMGMVASDILRESGYETFHAYDAQAAASVLDEHPEIEVVITEAALPGDVDGIELCRRVAEKRPEMQLVLTTSAQVSADVPGSAQVLRKPYASGDLKNLVAPKTFLLDA